MPREHWTTVRRTTSPLFTWVSRRVSISYAYTYTHGPRCVEKPLCCFPRFSLDGQWTYRRISFDLIDRRSLLVISSSRSPVKSRSTLSRNWPERSRNVVYLLAYSPCMGSIQFEYEQQSGERKRICIYPAVLISKISSSTKDDQPPIRRPNRPRSIILPTEAARSSFLSLLLWLSPSFSLPFRHRSVHRADGITKGNEWRERGRNWSITLLRFDSFATCYTYTCCTGYCGWMYNDTAAWNDKKKKNKL